MRTAWRDVRRERWTWQQDTENWLWWSGCKYTTWRLYNESDRFYRVRATFWVWHIGSLGVGNLKSIIMPTRSKGLDKTTAQELCTSASATSAYRFMTFAEAPLVAFYAHYSVQPTHSRSIYAPRRSSCATRSRIKCRQVTRRMPSARTRSPTCAHDGAAQCPHHPCDQ